MSPSSEERQNSQGTIGLVKSAKPLIHTFTVDASCNLKEGLVGIGIVLQATDKPGRRGTILETFKESYPAENLSKDMEKFAILRALEIAGQRGYKRVKVRSDYNQMRTQLKKDFNSGLIFERGALHRKILRLALEFELMQFGYCPRRKNQIAHKLAREAAGIKHKPKNIDDPSNQLKFDDFNYLIVKDFYIETQVPESVKYGGS